jgi:hypothetical protein
VPDRETELVIEDDTGNRRRLPLPSGEITVGRDPANVVCLPERNVSRRHALLAREGEGFVAEDLGSSNGVFLNGVRLEGRRPFAGGDRLRIGDFELWLQAAGRATDVTLPDAGAKTARARRRDATDRRDTAPVVAPSVVVRRGASWPWLVAVLFGLALGVLLGVWGQRSLTPTPPVPSSDTVAPLVPLVPAEIAGDEPGAPAPAPAAAPAPPPAAPRVPPPPAAVRPPPAPAMPAARPHLQPHPSRALQPRTPRPWRRSRPGATSHQPSPRSSAASPSSPAADRAGVRWASPRPAPATTPPPLPPIVATSSSSPARQTPSACASSSSSTSPLDGERPGRARQRPWTISSPGLSPRP